MKQKEDAFSGYRWTGGRGPTRVSYTLNEVAEACGICRRTLDRDIKLKRVNPNDLLDLTRYINKRTNYGTKKTKEEPA